MRNQDTLLPPMQVGAAAETSERLIEEIQHTGVVQSQDAAQATPAPDQDMTEGNEPPSTPVPVITRSYSPS